MRALHRLPLLLLAWTQAGWLLALVVLRRAGRGRVPDDREARPVPDGAPHPLATADGTLPTVSVVVAAHAEEAVIGATVRRLRAQRWAGPLEVLVACDGSPDATAARAREAGADVVLELPHGGKHAAQAAAVARASGDLLAFADANTDWEPDALAELLAPFADPAVGYACGRVSFVAAGGATNQEGAYWRMEMALRRMESDWWSVTAGNGAIYALRREAWDAVDVSHGHDLALPHQVVRRGWLALDRPTARASEPMVPELDAERARKRRMMAQAWRIVLRDAPGRSASASSGGGLLDPCGVPAPYLLALVSHRWLRYASPVLHLLALGAGVVLAVRRRAAPLDVLLLAAQLALLGGAAAAAPLVRGASSAGPREEAAPGRPPSWARPLLLARYYVGMTAAIGLGLHDHLRHGTPVGWAPAEGTRPSAAGSGGGRAPVGSGSDGAPAGPDGGAAPESAR